jgi:hypothetical protein
VIVSHLVAVDISNFESVIDRLLVAVVLYRSQLNPFVYFWQHKELESHHDAKIDPE